MGAVIKKMFKGQPRFLVTPTELWVTDQSKATVYTDISVAGSDCRSIPGAELVKLGDQESEEDVVPAPDTAASADGPKKTGRFQKKNPSEK